MTPDNLRSLARTMPDERPHLRQELMEAAAAWEKSLARLVDHIGALESARHADTARLDFLGQVAEAGVFVTADFIGRGATQRGPIWNCQTRDDMDEPVPHVSGTVREAIDLARGVPL